MNVEEAIGTLGGGLWHTTSERRYDGILSRMAILAEPPIPDDERWGTRCGPAGWPNVRTLGGVSLFDFEGFDVETYEGRCPSSSWREFVPFRRSWGASAWIEIDRVGAADALLGGDELLTRQSEEMAHRHRLMPYIEACYLGDVPRGLFVRGLVAGSGDAAFRSVSV